MHNGITLYCTKEVDLCTCFATGASIHKGTNMSEGCMQVTAGQLFVYRKHVICGACSVSKAPVLAT